MKKVEITKITQGYYVTKYYGNINQGRAFFKKKKAAEIYAKAWIEG